MRKVVMLVAVLLGTSFMVNANTITKKASTSKEVGADRHRKHRKVKKTVSNTAEVSKTKDVK